MSAPTHMQEVAEALAKRRDEHGDFERTATISRNLKLTAFGHEDQRPISEDPVCHEALSMILHKSARIASGDYRVRDHWLDIIGYASLALHRLDERYADGSE